MLYSATFAVDLKNVLELLISSGKDDLTGWLIFLYPLWLVVRLAINDGIFGLYERLFDRSLAKFSSALFYVIFIFGFMKYSGYVVAGNSHGWSAFDIVAIIAAFFIGEALRHLLFLERTQDVKTTALNLVTFIIVAAVMIRISSIGAGMTLTATEPHYESAQYDGTSKKHSGGKYKSIKYYVKVKQDDGSERYYTVSHTAAKAAQKSKQVGFVHYQSILGYEVRRLEIKGY